MKQLIQKLSNGMMTVLDTPIPIVGKGMVLVQNYYSLISAGTEGSSVVAARKGLIGKAKERPQQVKQVIDTFLQQGFTQTYRSVTKKLEAYSPLGYSCSGKVIGVGEGVTEFSIGDFVACGGVGYANHAEIVAVPVNLCVKLKNGSNLKNASYNTLGAIALQSIRQADLRLGETCAVIGLGLIGQLTGLMLKASGINVIGIDICENVVKQAKDQFADLALTRHSAQIENVILDFTNGIGVDAVVIAAATNSTDPINFAGAICRKKGKVIVLGAVPTGFDRTPYWYKKELDLRMSCSYGPGRYDINYEEKGVDYPVAYVRWTEKRNMEAFQSLLDNKKISIDYLTTHEFELQDAPKAYDMIVNKTEEFVGIIIKYNVTDSPVSYNKICTGEKQKETTINIGFVGAGNYAQANLLPYVSKSTLGVSCIGVLTNTGTTSLRVAERFGFEFCTSNEEDILKSSKINTLFVATRHDTHAEYVIKGLKNEKHVFVEKPLCITQEELDNIIHAKSRYTNQHLMVGFNRRYSSLSTILKSKIGEGPMTMIYRINAGNVPGDTWVQDMEVGGGRIIGEACHFIDYLTWLNGSLPISVYATALPDSANLNDTVNINVTFENGSTGLVAYYANGPKSMPKEYIEVFHNGSSGIINNFKELRLFGNSKGKKKLINIDKGQKQMIEHFLQSLITGNALIPFEEIISVSKATFAVLNSIKTGQVININ